MQQKKTLHKVQPEMFNFPFLYTTHPQYIDLIVNYQIEILIKLTVFVPSSGDEWIFRDYDLCKSIPKVALLSL